MIRTVAKRGVVAAVIAAGAGMLFTAPASAQVRRVEAGVLACRGSSSVSFFIGSRRTLACTFKTRRGPAYTYQGSISRWGVDLGVTGRNVLVWTVLAPSRGVKSSDLDGNYVGVSGSVALGLGVGGNVLVGGSQNTVALQPVSVEGQTGVNIALGVGDLRLRSN